MLPLARGRICDPPKIREVHRTSETAYLGSGERCAARSSGLRRWVEALLAAGRERAFARECFVLRPMFPEQPPDRRSRLLVPKSLPFTVVVARSDGDAKYAYRKLRRETTRFTFDLRERNVLTISDTGLHSATRRVFVGQCSTCDKAQLAHKTSSATA